LILTGQVQYRLNVHNFRSPTGLPEALLFAGDGGCRAKGKRGSQTTLVVWLMLIGAIIPAADIYPLAKQDGAE